MSRLLVKLAKGWWKAKVGVIWTFFFGCGSSVLGIEFQVHARACECVVMGSEILEVLGNQSQENENQPSDNVAPPPSWACPVNGLSLAPTKLAVSLNLTSCVWQPHCERA